MGRTMPSECEHGMIFSWGSFGAEDGSSKPEFCAECELDKKRARLKSREVLLDFCLRDGRIYDDMPKLVKRMGEDRAYDSFDRWKAERNALLLLRHDGGRA